jgi:hypothetical protein
MGRPSFALVGRSGRSGPRSVTDGTGPIQRSNGRPTSSGAARRPEGCVVAAGLSFQGAPGEGRRCDYVREDAEMTSPVRGSFERSPIPQGSYGSFPDPKVPWWCSSMILPRWFAAVGVTVTLAGWLWRRGARCWASVTIDLAQGPWSWREGLFVRRSGLRVCPPEDGLQRWRPGRTHQGHSLEALGSTGLIRLGPWLRLQAARWVLQAARQD